MQIPLNLPNLITFCNIFFGFASVVAVVRSAGGESFGLTQAAWFIIIAAIFDALDGKLARKMNRQSHFGMELDSLADVVSFGLAPSVLIYHAHFQGWAERGPGWGWLGIAVSSLPLIFGAFRLARFNMESARPPPRPPRACSAACRFPISAG
jgi:CDP-diacylglycerol--serine O-phosphatidyltransferase